MANKPIIQTSIAGNVPNTDNLDYNQIAITSRDGQIHIKQKGAAEDGSQDVIKSFNTTKFLNVEGQAPDPSSMLDTDLVINTTDGKAYFKKSSTQLGVIAGGGSSEGSTPSVVSITNSEIAGYGLTEVLTERRWTDGKPVYRKTFIGSELVDAATETSYTVSSISGITINSSESILRNTTTGEVIELPLSKGSTNYCQVYHSSTELGVQYLGNFVGYVPQVTIEYTKTADTNESPVATPTTNIKFANAVTQFDGGITGYSANETLTEQRWIDGKPLYRKVISGSLTTVSESVALNVTDGEFIFIDKAVGVLSNGAVVTDSYTYDNGTEKWQVGINSTKDSITLDAPTTEGWLPMEYSVVVLYTKSTDTNTTPVMTMTTANVVRETYTTPIKELIGYSEEEQVTERRWVDGKPIYRKVEKITCPSSQTTIDTNLPIDEIERAYVAQFTCTRTDGYIITESSEINGGLSIIAKQDGSIIHVNPTNGSIAGQDIYVVFEYTKTEDTMNSNTAVVSGTVHAIASNAPDVFDYDEIVTNKVYKDKKVYRQIFEFVPVTFDNPDYTYVDLSAVGVEDIVYSQIRKDKEVITTAEVSTDQTKSRLWTLSPTGLKGLLGSGMDGNYEVIVEYTKVNDAEMTPSEIEALKGIQLNYIPDVTYPELDSYSTTETLSNRRWIDGKPIYRTVVEMTGTADVELRTAFANDVDSILVSDFIITDSGVVSNSVSVSYDSSTEELVVNHSADFTGVAIVEYTKNADNAASPIAEITASANLRAIGEGKVYNFTNYGSQQGIAGQTITVDTIDVNIKYNDNTLFLQAGKVYTLNANYRINGTDSETSEYAKLAYWDLTNNVQLGNPSMADSGTQTTTSDVALTTFVVPSNDIEVEIRCIADSTQQAGNIPEISYIQGQVLEFNFVTNDSQLNEYNYTRTIDAGEDVIFDMGVDTTNSVVSLKEFVDVQIENSTLWDFDVTDTAKWELTGTTLVGGKVQLASEYKYAESDTTDEAQIVQATEVTVQNTRFNLSRTLTPGTFISSFGLYSTSSYTTQILVGCVEDDEVVYASGIMSHTGTGFEWTDVSYTVPSNGKTYVVGVSDSSYILADYLPGENWKGSASTVFTGDPMGTDTGTTGAPIIEHKVRTTGFVETATAKSIRQVNTGTYTDITGVSVTQTVPVNTDVSYKFSFDGGSTWTEALDGNFLAGHDWSQYTIGDWMDVEITLSTTDVSVTPTVDVISVNGRTQGVWAHTYPDPSKYVVSSFDNTKILVRNVSSQQKQLKIHIENN